MLTITTPILLAVSIVLMGLAKTVLKHRVRTTTFLMSLWRVTIVAVLGLVAVGYPTSYTISPPVILYVLTPIIVGICYAFRQWHKHHPGAISAALVAIIKGIFRVRNTRRRTASKSTDAPVASRGYLRQILGSWISLATRNDTALWCLAHMLLIEAGFWLALYAPALPFGGGYLIGYVPALVSFIRWRSIDKKRQTVINNYYGFAMDQFGYERAARNTRMTGYEKFSDPNACVSVQWREMTEPDVVTIAFPQSFEKTNQTKREKFSREFEATYRSATVKKFLWDTGKQTVTVIAANYPEDVRWNGAMTRQWHSFVFGVQLDSGKKVVLSVKDQASHILVAGEVGSGKTETMFVIVAQAMLKGWQVALCDPKGTGWVAFTQNFRYTNEAGPGTGAVPLKPGDARPGLIWHAIDVYGIATVVEQTWKEVERRKAINIEHRATSSTDLDQSIRDEKNIRPYLLVIDEALSLFATDKGKSDEIEERNDLREAILGTVIRIIVEARALQVHTMLGFQRPDTRYIDGSARDNLSIRIGLGKFGEDGRNMVYGTREVPELPLRKNGVDSSENDDDDADAVVKGRGQVRLGAGAPVQNVQSMWFGPGHEDLDKHLPMPEAPEQLNNAPTTTIDDDPLEDDTSPTEDVSGQEQDSPAAEPINRPGPWRATDAPTTQYPTAPGNQEAKVVHPEQALKSVPTGPITPHEDPFGAAEDSQDTTQDPWTSNAKPWPGVTEEPTEASEVPSAAGDEGERIVDAKQGRVAYSAPVEWQVHTTDPMFSEGTDLFSDDPEESIEANAGPFPETAAPAEPAKPKPNVGQADFAAFFDDHEPVPAPRPHRTTVADWTEFLDEKPAESPTPKKAEAAEDEEWF